MACPATNSRTRATNRALLTSPIFSPKPRRMPRMLSSTSSSLACSSLRATSRARISCVRRRLGVHRPEPSHAQQLGDPARILAVGLDHHRRQRRLHVPRLQQHTRSLPPPGQRAATAREVPPPARSGSPAHRARGRSEPAPPARSPPWLRGRSCPPRPPRTRCSVPTTRRSRQNAPRLSSDDAWGRSTRTPLIDTITLGDSRPASHSRRRPITASSSLST